LLVKSYFFGPEHPWQPALPQLPQFFGASFFIVENYYELMLTFRNLLREVLGLPGEMFALSRKVLLLVLLHSSVNVVTVNATNGG
jgi:hypothetical protein